MEIEAKFAVVDQEVAKELQNVETADAFRIAPGNISRVRDTYLDTRDRRLLAAGFSCRSRQEGNVHLVTIKQLKKGQSAIQEREEFEISLNRAVPPSEWPEGPARERLMSITGEEPLQVLFELHQRRLKRDMIKSGVAIAEWSVDEVIINTGKTTRSFSELEIELTQGTREDLAHISAYVQSKWGLVPQRSSKFERVLPLVDAEFGAGSPAQTAAGESASGRE